MKNLSKTYKFIYMTNYGMHNQHVRSDYVFANREPKGYGNKFAISSFFRNTDDFTMRKYFSDKPIRRQKRENFLQVLLTKQTSHLRLSKSLLLI
jgi:hypothetical protein